jgi:hypothetical protein
MKQKTLTLKDSDGDGIIYFEWDDKHDGIKIELVDWLFDHSTVGTFYKRDLVKTLKKLINKLEPQNELV